MKKVILSEPFKSMWHNCDPFNELEKLNGKIYRTVKTRRTLRIEVHGKGYFVKIHNGIGWQEIIKNLLTVKLPVIGALPEFRAIQKLKKIGISTLTPVAYCEKGYNPATKYSFLITEELPPSISLEDFTIDWKKNKPAPILKRSLINKIAQIASKMHSAGIHHSDHYICHFMLLKNNYPINIDITVIDLHRSKLRKVIPTRLRNKDLAALYFSILKIGLTRNDKLLFLRTYFGKGLREIFLEEHKNIIFIEKKVEKLFKRKQRYGDKL